VKITVYKGRNEKMRVENLIEEYGLELPNAPVPVGAYIPVQIAGNIAYLSGQTARINGVRRYVGKVGDTVSKEEAYFSSRDACLNCLAALKAAIGELDKVQKIVKLVGFVNSAPGFNQQPAVLNGASDLLHKLYGDNGKHARSAVGVAELPFNASVELEMVIELVE